MKEPWWKQLLWALSNREPVYNCQAGCGRKVPLWALCEAASICANCHHHPCTAEYYLQHFQATRALQEAIRLAEGRPGPGFAEQVAERTGIPLDVVLQALCDLLGHS